MKLATTTSDFMCFGLNGEESVGAVADAGFKYIDYGFGYDFHGKTGLLGNEWQSCAERRLLWRTNADLNSFRRIRRSADRLFSMMSMRSSFVSQSKALQPPLTSEYRISLCIRAMQRICPKPETFKQNKLFYEDILKVAEKARHYGPDRKFQ